MAEIRIENVTKVFGDTIAVNDTSLVVRDKEFLVLLGPSGCGKTTLLRTIAGLGMADAGRITIDGRDVTYLPAGERMISMVFQSYAIFPHMSVRDNIGFGLRMRKVSNNEITRRVDDAAELLHIGDLLDRRPSDMSGGQRQRVAVARALAMQAEVLLMDEPLSNLDALLRLEMRAELKRLLAEVDATTIYVTHDQIEALSMGDRIAVMRDGVVQQLDEPSIVYSEPTNEFVGSFIGNPPMNFLDATMQSAQGVLTAEFDGNSIVPASDMTSALAPYADQPIRLGIRAENMHTVDATAGAPPADAIEVEVAVVEPLGSQNLLTIALGGHQLKVSTHPSFEAAPGQSVWLRFPADQIRWIDPTTRQVITPESAGE